MGGFGVPELHLDAVIYEDNNLFVAHVLQLDLVGTGTNKTAAINDLIASLEAQFSYAFENDNMRCLGRPAPPEIWEMFAKTKAKATKRKIPAPKLNSKSKWTFPASLITVPALV
jgi:hypothetical protein